MPSLRGCHSDEGLSQLPARAEESRFNRSTRTAKQIGNRLILHPVQVPQDCEPAEIGRQGRHGSPNRLPLDEHLVEVMGFVQTVEQRVPRAFAAVGPQSCACDGTHTVSAGLVDRQSDQPRCERGVAAEGADKSVDSDKHILRDVVDGIGLNDTRQSDLLVDESSMAMPQRLEGLRITALEVIDEPMVLEANDRRRNTVGRPAFTADEAWRPLVSS